MKYIFYIVGFWMVLLFLSAISMATHAAESYQEEISLHCVTDKTVMHANLEASGFEMVMLLDSREKTGYTTFWRKDSTDEWFMTVETRTHPDACAYAAGLGVWEKPEENI